MGRGEDEDEGIKGRTYCIFVSTFVVLYTICECL